MVNGILKIMTNSVFSPLNDVEVQMMSKEISLYEIIEIVLKGKWIIISITLASIILSATFSYFIIEPTYETYSIVRMQSATKEDGKKITNIKEFQESLKSASTLNSMIVKNQLQDGEYTINSIRNMFELEVVPDSNIMKITVRGDNPEKISKLANMLAYELGIRIEITNRTGEIVKAQEHLEILQDQIVIIKAKLYELNNQLKVTPEKLITNQALSDNDLLRSLEQERSGISTKEAAQLNMQSESINPNYTDLQAKISQSTIELNALEAEAKNYQNKVNLNMSRIDEIDSKASNEKLDVNKSIRILDGTSAIFINPALQPEEPVGPKKLLNIIMASVVGVMLSLLIVFLRNYLREVSKEDHRSGVNV